MYGATYASTMFEACPDCHVTYGQTYDKDSAKSTEAARAALAAQVLGCNHVGVTSL